MSAQRVARWALVLSVFAVPRAFAQDRDALIARAFNEPDPNRRAELLVGALNPNAGPPGGAWGSGIQLLAQTLLDQGRDSVAATWLRWGIRLDSTLRVDTLQFPPRLIRAFGAAREFVARTSSPDDARMTTTWSWPVQAAGEPSGRIQLSPSAALPQPVVTVAGVGGLPPGDSLTLPTGSYRVLLRAGETDSAMIVTREVLPGVMTVLGFAPIPHVLRPDSAPRLAEERAAPHMERRRRIPWKWVAVGVAGVGALMAVLAGGAREGPRTGGIIITLPGP